MNTRTLGRTGFQVSEIGFGAAPAAYLKPDAANAAAMLNALLDSGVNLIDTATSYPGSQAFIGEHLSHRRNDYVLVSKASGTFEGIDGADWSAAVITACVDNALREAKTDHLDVMLLHTCDLETLKNGEALGALAEAREAGKIRFAGYSGDNEAAAFAAGHPEVAVLETSINIVDQANIDLVLPVAREHQVGVIVKRPVANACWKNPADQPGMYKNYSANYTRRLATMAITPSDLGFTGDPLIVWPEIALRFTLSLPEVASLLVGTTNPDNARRNVDAAGKGPLPPDTVATLRDAFKRANLKGEWTGQT